MYALVYTQIHKLILFIECYMLNMGFPMRAKPLVGVLVTQISDHKIFQNTWKVRIVVGLIDFNQIRGGQSMLPHLVHSLPLH